MPYPASSVASAGATATGSGLASRLDATAPPRKMPNTKNRFHASRLQLYWKNGILAGRHEAQMCRSEELMPKDLLPSTSKAGTVSPTKGPATYQGQGCFNRSIIKHNYVNGAKMHV